MRHICMKLKMATIVLYLCSLLLGYLPLATACSCQINIAALACSTDFGIFAQLLDEKQVSPSPEVYHYNVSVTGIVWSNDAYRSSEKTIQVTLHGTSCDPELKVGNKYFITGHVVEFTDSGVTRRVLDTEFCKYIDMLYLSDDLANQIVDVTAQPPTCDQLNNDSVRESGNFLRALGAFKRWNNPFKHFKREYHR